MGKLPPLMPPPCALRRARAVCCPSRCLCSLMTPLASLCTMPWPLGRHLMSVLPWGGGDHLLARISRSFWRARKFATSVLSETDSEGLPERRSRLTWLPSPPPLAKNPPAPTGDAPMPQLEPEARSGLPWRLLTTPLAPALKSPGTRAPAAASLVALSPCQEAAGASASRASRWRFRRGQMPQICGMRASIQPTARSRATKKMTA